MRWHHDRYTGNQHFQQHAAAAIMIATCIVEQQPDITPTDEFRILLLIKRAC